MATGIQPDRTVVAFAALSPVLIIVVNRPETEDWNWPFGSLGIVISAFFGGVLFQQRELSGSALPPRPTLPYRHNRRGPIERRCLAPARDDSAR